MKYLNTLDRKIELDYPCLWLYKVIGREKQALLSAVSEILGEADYTMRPSKQSRTGKFISYDVEIKVFSEERRDYIFHTLREHPAIVMVL